VFPDHVLPDQELPDQVLADHVDPDHVEADHVLADHVLPDHELADHVEPDHVLPFQSPPDHVLADASAAASTLESTGRPKMSFSPLRMTPSRVRWSCPRELSIEPVPVASAYLGGLYDQSGVAFAIGLRRISPPP
jgi:hypothetical protein